MKGDKESIIKTIDLVFAKHNDFLIEYKKINYKDSHLRRNACLTIFPFLCDVIERLTPNTSFYEFSAKQIIEKCDTSDEYSLFQCMNSLLAVLSSLKMAYENDLLIELKEIYHADIFNDFLEMGEYLLNEGYKDAAAVMIGGVIEEHIKKLCLKNSLSLFRPDSKPISTNQLVSDLYSKNFINRGDSKNLTAYLEIRNNAAHAKYADYNEENVKIMLLGVREFIARCPA
jgi:uncharacterized protein (DUF2164 family)